MNELEELISEVTSTESIAYHKVYPPAVERFTEADDLFVRDYCQKKGIRLYSHQQQAIDLIINGRNTCIITPTSSGKTLAYHIPVIKSFSEDCNAKALFIYPLKALAQDQKEKLRQNMELVSPFMSAEIYDGDTPAHHRSKIRQTLPQCIITNPDMLHFGFLPSHHQWEEFFSNLRYIVFDEVHAYRGIFGSHVAWIIRRLDRVLQYYGAKPVFIATSATIGNPGPFLKNLFNREFSIVKESGAYSPPRHFFILNPDEISVYKTALNIFLKSIGRSLRTIVFTKSRKITELIYNYAIQSDKKLRDKISSYRSGYMPEERREIEQKLFSGELLGVISTSALELGIDIGNLDVCILVGYPGSMINTFQRSGRVGRGHQPAAIYMLAQQDALDQFFVKNPDQFFNRSFEDIIVDPQNPFVSEKHLVCASWELPLRIAEVEPYKEVVKQMVGKGALLEHQEGKMLFPADKRPYLKVNIREAGDSYSIVNGSDNTVIGSISGPRVLTECHQGAIYLHRGVNYFVSELDIGKKKVIVREDRGDYYTRPYISKETEIIKVFSEKIAGNVALSYAWLKVTEKVVGYERKSVFNQNVLSREELDLPPYIFETAGLVINIPDAVTGCIEENNFHLMGSLHATEHALIGLMPTIVLCDRFDLGGICYPYHFQTKGAAIFIYDGYEGGAGLAFKGYQDFDTLINSTLQLLIECPCEGGCPSCIHSPKCGSQNFPLDKAGAVFLIQRLTDNDARHAGNLQMIVRNEDVKKRTGLSGENKKIVFFDLETQKLAADVGGWDNIHLMGMSLAVVYDKRSDIFEYFEEKDVLKLIHILETADLVVGYNTERFDYTVLSAYYGRKFKPRSYDIFKEIYEKINSKRSLKTLAELNLGDIKLGEGIQAVEWFRNGEMEKLKEYCKRDVELVRDLFYLLEERGYLLCEVNKQIVKLILPPPVYN